MYLWFILIILFLLYFMFNKVENFDYNDMHQKIVLGKNPAFTNRHLLGRQIHVEIGKKGEIISQNYNSPPQSGKLGCTQVPCPQYIHDNITCWSCC